ncbi:MAG: ISKra4 family transposase, partial [Steroidobacteraceae bacterium]
EGPEAAALAHAELEDQLDARGRELLRKMLQDHLSLRALSEVRAQDVTDADGVVHGAVEAGHRRPLTTIFGKVDVERLAYRHRAHPNLHPADALLNLPTERHSHGLRRLSAVEGSRGSFEEAAAALERATGQHVGKRQVESLSAKSATDVEDFYATRPRTEVDESDVLVISADGKGIVMRPDSLRDATAKAAAAARNKLTTRLSKGEKRNRNRMAEVVAVYDVTHVPRAPHDVMASKAGEEQPPEAPKAKNKWLTASVVEDAAEVVGRLFDEAERRDPGHKRRWVALVDGNNHQIDRIGAEAMARGIDITIVVDLVHVLEYMWAAAWCFFAEGDTAAEEWVRDRAHSVLEGHAREVAAGIRRRATAEGLAKSKRKKADDCAKYLVNKAPHLDYPAALSSGWPIATGIIETTVPYCGSEQYRL